MHDLESLSEMRGMRSFLEDHQQPPRPYLPKGKVFAILNYNLRTREITVKEVDPQYSQ